MPRVVEVKVAVKDYEATASAIYDLTDSMGTIYRQEDTVFVAPAGGQLWLGSVDGSVSISDLLIGRPGSCFFSNLATTQAPCGDLVFQKNFGTKQPMESEYYITSITDKESFKVCLATAIKYC
ncbi:unnamed protein product [Soboliphyme baturini]|uniref:Peptidase A1 domain-containing protein n=1 Tax=Soboliphyme baturini TaxID=241478 RepID=A0A183IGS9_9BILA|nr:unnamed protein product [Soboliphyme baturini]